MRRLTDLLPLRTAVLAVSAWALLIAAARPAPVTGSSKKVQTGAIIWLDGKSPYYAAGLRSRDLITEAAGKEIRNDSDFYKVFAATTNTAEIEVSGLRRGKEPFHVRVPAYLPSDVTVGSYGWDWLRYLKYYAPDPSKPDPLLEKAYRDFDLRRYAYAQIGFTSATAKGLKDPLTLTKLAWLILSRSRSNIKERVDAAAKLLKEAEDKFDPTTGDRETQAKIEGTWMIYYQRLGNTNLAAVHGRKAIRLAPQLVGNRINYYRMLMDGKRYGEAAMASNELAAEYPRSVYFLRLKKNANLRVNQMKEVIESCEALVDIMPDDVATRLQLLPFLDEISDNFNILNHCDFLLRTKKDRLNDRQLAEIYYYQARVYWRRHSFRKAQSLVRQSINLHPTGNAYFLLGDIYYSRRKWKDAVVAFRESSRKPWTVRRTRETWREMRKKMDEAIDHLWSWQVKALGPDIVKRKEWLKERAVLKHSFIMRNRYQIRNVLIVIGSLLILSGVVLRFVSRYQ